jgi:hypothetical protein
MAYFKTNNNNLGKFRRVVCTMEDVGILYCHLVCFFGNLVYFVDLNVIWYILKIFSSFGIFSVLVCCTKIKSGSPDWRALVRNSSETTKKENVHRHKSLGNTCSQCTFTSKNFNPSIKKTREAGVVVMVTIDRDFRLFSATKLAFFSKTNVVIEILKIFESKTPIFCRLFLRKYLKNHNIGPWLELHIISVKCCTYVCM